MQDLKKKVSKELTHSRNENISEDCGKSFARKDDLKQHLKTHTKPKVTVVKTDRSEDKLGIGITNKNQLRYFLLVKTSLKKH